MKQPFYEFTGDQDSFRFEFISKGKSLICKAVIFQPLQIEDFYNLAMGDVIEDGDIDVLSRSNNGDMEIILSTIVQIVMQFLRGKPNARILIKGSTPVRIRLYQIAIDRELQNFEEYFTVMGFSDNDFEPFRRNVNYSALVISLKKN